MATIRDWLLTDELTIQASGTSEGAYQGWNRRAFSDKARRQEDDPGRVQPYYRIKGPGGEERRAWGFPRRRGDRPLEAESTPGKCPACGSRDTKWIGSHSRTAKCNKCGNYGISK